MRDQPRTTVRTRRGRCDLDSWRQVALTPAASLLPGRLCLGVQTVLNMRCIVVPVNDCITQWPSLFKANFPKNVRLGTKCSTALQLRQACCGHNSSQPAPLFIAHQLFPQRDVCRKLGCFNVLLPAGGTTAGGQRRWRAVPACDCVHVCGRGMGCGVDTPLLHTAVLCTMHLPISPIPKACREPGHSLNLRTVVQAGHAAVNPQYCHNPPAHHGECLASAWPGPSRISSACKPRSV